MAGRERKYTPRVRTQRPLSVSRTTNEPPSKPLPAPVERDGFWFLPAPLSQRLHEKSGLGQTTRDGGILLTVEEVMFCHWYRHVPLPSDSDWFDQRISDDEALLSRLIGMDVLRNGGERVIPAVHLKQRFPNLPASTWAIRWERHEPWTRHEGFSQVRIQRTHDLLDWNELNHWVASVHEFGHVAELCVIDDEFDATVYHLKQCEPQGDRTLLSDLDEQQQLDLKAMCEDALPANGGYFVSNVNEWLLDALGVSHFSGRFLRIEEHEYILSSNKGHGDQLYRNLINARLLLRPGFKYGCRWRAYETAIEVEHAPWLVQPFDDAPSTWEEVCLSVRLAEGVNKRWLCALPQSEGFVYLNIKRSG